MPAFRSLLYREPRLYDLVFPDWEGTTAAMVRTAIERYGPAPLRSVLDVGCGSRAAPGSARPFDLVTCLGNAIAYALTDRDLADTLDTLAAHTHDRTLLVADALNARAYLEGDGFRERIAAIVETPEFKATSVALHLLDREARILRRSRTWHIAGRPDVEDYAEYRLLFPDEVRQSLEACGFEVLGLYDNRQFEPTDLTGRIPTGPDMGGMRGRKLYVVARKVVR